MNHNNINFSISNNFYVACNSSSKKKGPQTDKFTYLTLSLF